MSRPNLIYYFKDREALVDAAIKYITAQAQAFTVKKISGITAPRDQLFAFVNATVDWAETYPAHAKFTVLYYHYCTFDPKYRELHRRIRQAGAERIEAILTRLTRNATGERAKSIQELITGALLEHLTTELKTDFSKVRQRLVASVEALLS